MKLYLVRHGQKEGWNRDSPLAELGIEQVKRLGISLKNKKIDKIYCSTWLRAKQTLDHLKPYLGGIDIKYTNQIREHDHGDLKTKKEFEEKLKETGLKEHEFSPQNGENFYDLEKRAQNFLIYLKENHPQDNILLVSHGRFLRFLILRALKLHMREFQFFSLHEASLSTLNFDKDFNITKYEIDENRHLIRYSSYERELVEKI